MLGSQILSSSLHRLRPEPQNSVQLTQGSPPWEAKTHSTKALQAQVDAAGAPPAPSTLAVTLKGGETVFLFQAGQALRVGCPRPMLGLPGTCASVAQLSRCSSVIGGPAARERAHFSLF